MGPIIGFAVVAFATFLGAIIQEDIMKENLEPALARVKLTEGGLSMDRRDRGNWSGGRVGVGKLRGTKYGIAANSFPTEDIRNLTWERAKELYRQRYAAPIRFDELPAGVDYAVLDYSINSGEARAAMALQRAAGVADDGKIGPVTIAAVRKLDPALLVRRICADRLAFLSRLKTWKTYGKGWSKRVEQVEHESLKLAGGVQIAAR